MKKVVVGLSGGVDSAVSAFLLKQQGYDVLGLFMKNWEDDGICEAAVDFEDVAEVCKVIDIPFYTVNFAKEYQESVFAEFLQECRAGRTPNPDILCNREIKFKAFFQKAKELGADFLATGHYCQLREIDGTKALVKGSDSNKDQSYFLYAVQGKILNEVLFPVGHLPKPEVRRIAEKAGLPNAKKRDSTGICFIGKRDYKEFLNQYLKYESGEFQTVEGECVGNHDGLPFYTIGQRKGLGIGGKGNAWFVVRKDIERNVIVVAQGENHPALYSSRLKAQGPHWISGKWPGPLPYRCFAKVRYRQQDEPCEILSWNGNEIEVNFFRPQRAVTAGQSIVFYQNEICLGGAIISTPDLRPNP